MKNYLFVVSFLFAVSFANAQSNTVPLFPKSSFLDKNDWKFHIPQKNLFRNSPALQPVQPNTSIDNMPVAGKIPSPVFIENKNEFDIYQSPLDQMAIAETDKNFHSNMPVKIIYFSQEPQVKVQ